MKEKIVYFLRKNYLPLLFALVSVSIELTAVFVTSGDVHIHSPWVFLSVLAFLTGVQYLFRSRGKRFIFSSVCLSVQFLCDIIFIVIYEMTGTTFDFSMFKLRGDAMAILESVPINFAYTAIAGIFLSSFVVFGRSFEDSRTVPATQGAKRAISAFLAVIVLCCVGSIYASAAKKGGTDEYLKSKLYDKAAEGYADMGIMGNFIAEVCGGVFSKVEVGNIEEIGDFIYSEVSDDSVYNFGAAEGYNVVTILCESLEWFAFMQDEELYPYGHTVSEEVLRELYPNLYEFYDSSYVMTNFHAREKTDISENLSLIGNYPTDYYLNHNYPENNIAYSLPNTLKTLYGVESYSFHNGTRTFYNRDEYLPTAVGFEEFISSEMMAGDEMTNYFLDGERNLDSEMIESCKEQMFPTDRRFNTYITTITMHGQYAHRDNLQEYYDILDEKGILPLSEEIGNEAETANAFRHYAAMTMDLDKAIGIMMDHLEETGLIENTLIVLFSDHNTYYQSLSNYVKDIYPKEDPSEVTELYRVPLMIKAGTQTAETVFVDKFVCTADILPTVMSLLGIRYYSNLYYGNSAFSEQESILYSRAYDVFMTDRIYFKNFSNITWSSPENDDSYLKEIEDRAVTLLENISYVNRIFAADYFRGAALEEYEQNMLQINQ